MVYCKKCGKKIPDDSEYCPEYGAKQNVSIQKRVKKVEKQKTKPIMRSDEKPNIFYRLNHSILALSAYIFNILLFYFILNLPDSHRRMDSFRMQKIRRRKKR